MSRSIRFQFLTALFLVFAVAIGAGCGGGGTSDTGPGLPDPIPNPGDPHEPEGNVPFRDVDLRGNPALVGLAQEKDSFYLINDSTLGGGNGMYIVSPQGAVRQSGAQGGEYTSFHAISASSYYAAEYSQIPPVRIFFDDPGLNPSSPFSGITDTKSYRNEEVADDGIIQYYNLATDIWMENSGSGVTAHTPFAVDPATEMIYWKVPGVHTVTYDDEAPLAGWTLPITTTLTTAGMIISHVPEYIPPYHQENFVGGGFSQQPMTGEAFHIYLGSPMASGSYFSLANPKGDVADLLFGGSSWQHGFFTPDPLNYPIQRNCTIDSITDFEFNSKRQLVIVTGQNSHSLVIAEPFPIESAGQDSFSPGVNFLATRYMGGIIDTFSTEPGEFYYPSHVAIDPRNDHILVSDTGNHRVQIMDEFGSFIRQIGVGVASNLPGGLAAPQTVMVDNEGTIFVVDTNLDTGLPRMQRFRETSPNPEFGAIGGTVYDRVTGLPIPGVLVAIQDQYLDIPPVSTDFSGGFRFDNVPIGLYQIAAVRDNYFSGNTFARVTTSFETNVNLFLAPKQGNSGAGTLYGTVADSTNGSPLSGILVEIRGVGANAVTDHQGSWEINGLAAGDFVVDYSDPNGAYRSGTRSVRVFENQSTQVDMLMDPLP